MTAVDVAERIDVTGVVQGVGFRPFVHRLANELGLDGTVGNDSAQVYIEVAGTRCQIDRLVDGLRSGGPPLARVDHVSRAPMAVRPRPGFRIVESRSCDGPRTLVPPDTALCKDCIEELFDPTDRRFRHPFITCTNCGPRFTIIESLPYDRPNTTMAGFGLCATCAAEYRDPEDRRFHAQPIACHDCGPTLTYRPAGPDEAGGTTTDPIGATVEALARGEIVAIKGLGGYHLACDATDDDAVATLRVRKRRADKPLAVMVADVDAAAAYAHIDEDEAAMLGSAAAPIVLLRAREDSPVSEFVAPGNPLIGIMVAYTPVHHLLLAGRGGPLVMTSANRSGEPIAYRPGSIDELSDLHDAVLDHDRPIRVPCDDSVVRVVDDRRLPIRRARGYAPLPVPFAGTTRRVLAVGGELKNTFCITSGGNAWVSQHIGDMENLETVRAFEASIGRFGTIFDVAPDVTVADSHPGYLTSKWACDQGSGPVMQVQHHHAHVAAAMAEHHLDPTGTVLGFAFDGTGYGDDGTIWGGEVLVANAVGYERVAHLAPIPLPGGDAAVRHPCRTALAHLWAAGLDWSDHLPPVREFDTTALGLLRRQLERRVACVTTTSMGRLFDAVASLSGLRHHATYEAQAAIELEVAAGTAAAADGRYRFGYDGAEIDPAPVLAAIVEDLGNATPVGCIAWSFHDAIAEVVTRVAVEVCAARRVDAVVLTGGTFQNVLLTRLCVDRLAEAGITALTHRAVPPNDGGLALGQAFIGAHTPVRQAEGC